MKRFLILTALTLTAPPIASAALTDELVLYLPFDEGRGAHTADFSFNKLRGEIFGNPKWVDGKFDKALRFTSPAHSVSVTNNDEAVQIGDAITQAAWVKLDRLPFANATIFSIAGDVAEGFGRGQRPDGNPPNGQLPGNGQRPGGGQLPNGQQRPPGGRPGAGDDNRVAIFRYGLRGCFESHRASAGLAASLLSISRIMAA